MREVIYFKRAVYMRALTELAPLAFPRGKLPPYPEWWAQYQPLERSNPEPEPGD